MTGLDDLKGLFRPERSHEFFWMLHKAKGEFQEQKVQKFCHLHSYFYWTLNLRGGEMHFIMGGQKKKQKNPPAFSNVFISVGLGNI